MNQFQVMGFVDKATAQQLKQMVNARDPYSYMALAKLQEMRDAEMKKTAGQPDSPPLSEVIPQQLAQAESGQAVMQSLQRPQGIAALQPMQQQQMPQPMPQPMPQQMPQPSQQDVPAGAGGGLVSFKEGGGIRGYDGTRSSLVPEWRRDIDASSSPFLGVADAMLDSAARSQNERYGQKNEQDRQNELQAASNETNLGFFERATPYQAQVRENATNWYRDLKSNPNAPYPGQPSAPATSTSPQPAAAPAPVGGAKIGETKADVKTDKVRPSGPGGISDLPFGFKKSSQDIATAQLLAEFERQNQIGELSASFRDPAAERKELSDLYGTPEQTDAAIKGRMESLDKALPDQNKRIAEQLNQMRSEVGKSEENAPYQGLLKMAVNLMATNKTNLFQAVGEAGGAGLEEFNKMQAANKAQKMALLSADASLAAAQDARQRGLYNDASRLVENAQAKKLEVYKAGNEAKFHNVGVGLQIAAARVNAADADVRDAQSRWALNQYVSTYQLQKKQLEVSMAGVEAANKPAVAKILDWLDRNPGKKLAFESYQMTERASANALHLLTELPRLQKTWDDAVGDEKTKGPRPTSDWAIETGLNVAKKIAEKTTPLPKP